MRKPGKKRLWPIVVGVVVTLLAAAVFTLGSLNVPLVLPEQGNAFVILFAATIFVFAAFFVFALILIRTLLKTWSERRTGQMGSRFKVKMIAAAVAVSLLPVIFLFFFSYALVNRTLISLFPKPLEIANEQYQILLTDFGTAEFKRLSGIAHGGRFAANAESELSGVEPRGGRLVDCRRARRRQRGNGFSEGLAIWPGQRGQSDRAEAAANDPQRCRSLEGRRPALSRRENALSRRNALCRAALASGFPGALRAN